MNYNNSDRDKRNEDNQDDIVDWVYDEFQKFFKMPFFKKQLKELLHTLLLSDNKNIYGLKINIEPINTPILCKYFQTNSKLVNYDRHLYCYNKHIKINDIIEGKKEIYVTAEIPDVNRNDINLNATEDTVEINVDNPIIKYSELIDLPSKIRPKKIKYTIKNGILDITLEKKRFISRKLSKNQN
jgi:HSP20 family protein